jgi:hypothetical protein
VNGTNGTNGTSGTSGTSVSVSGTANYVVKFTGSGTTIGNTGAPIFDDGTNVGIGTTSPANRLEISGSNGALLRLRAPGIGNNYILYSSGSTNLGYVGYGSDVNNGLTLMNYQNDRLNLGINSTIIATISGSNFGIGTTTPKGRLGIGINQSSMVSTQGITLGTDESLEFLGSTFGSGYGNKIYTADTGDSTGTDLRIATRSNITSWTDRITLKGTGNVGIGTITPDAKFEIKSSAANNLGGLLLRANGTTNYPAILYENSSNGGTLDLFNSANTLTTKISSNGDSYFNGGHVGIGNTSPLQKLHITQAVDASNPTLGTGKGALFIAGDTNLYGLYVGINTSTGNTYFQAMRNNTATAYNILLNPVGGNVGVGVATPTATLTVSKAASNFMFDLENATETDFKLRTYNSGSSGAGTAVFTQGLYYTTNENGAIKFHRGGGGTDGFLTFSTSATERVRIDASGNVGIGTTPSTKLHIIGSASIAVDGSGQDTSPYAPLGVTRANTASNLAYIGMTKTAVVPWGIGISSNNFLIVGAVTANTQVIATPIMTWDYVNSSVGIGTTSPRAKLDVEGAIIIQNNNNLSWGNTYGAGVPTITATSGSAAALLFYPAGSTSGEKVRIDITGSVGIGTTSPSYKLDVNGTFRSKAFWNDNDGLCYWGSGTTPTAYGILTYDGGSSPYAAVYAAGGNNLRLGANGQNTYLYISSSGNIGIGTTTPQKILEVISTANDFVSVGVNQVEVNSWTGIHFGYREANNLYRKSAIVFERTDLTSNNAQGKVHILNGPQAGSGNATLSDAKITIAENGNVGINTTTPYQQLEVNGAISAIGPYNYDVSQGHATMLSVNSGVSYLVAVDWGVEYKDLNIESKNLYLRTGGGGTSIRVTVTEAGLVGVNNTSPSYRLDVSGSARINVGALGVNVAPNATNGRIDASNDIVAYSSDKRLKTNIQLIENPLDKIGKLNGFTYHWNDKAAKLANYDINESLVGVYAQEVQAVLPEAVKLAPFDNDGNNKSISGENYLTVQYEKIVPLLIEAIKELKAEIDILKNK